jgi:multidrug efflux system membrane fusion protein
MNRSARLAVVIGGLLSVAAVAVSVRGRTATGAPASASSASAGGDRVIPVATAVVGRKDVPIILDGLGTATPLATVAVKTQVDGRLDRVAFTEGQAVKKGDVLALIDPRPFTIQLHQAEAVLARDDAQLRNGKVNLDRYEALRKEGLVPQQQVDDQRAAVDQLEATLRSDKTQIENARLLLDFTRIVSPIDGVTGVRQVDPGNLVHPSDPGGIVVITQIDPMAVIFTLPQDDLQRVQQAMKEGKVIVDAYARDGVQKLASGELLLVDNQVNAQTATIRLKAVLPNADHALWPNAFVKARMRLTTLKNALVAPASAIQRGPNGAFVYVVGADKTASPRPVEVGTIEGDRAVIAKGVAEGDVVVTDGQSQLRPGSRVAAHRGGVPAASSSVSSAAPASSTSSATSGDSPRTMP